MVQPDDAWVVVVGMDFLAESLTYHWMSFLRYKPLHRVIQGNTGCTHFKIWIWKTSIIIHLLSRRLLFLVTQNKTHWGQWDLCPKLSLCYLSLHTSEPFPFFNKEASHMNANGPFESGHEEKWLEVDKRQTRKGEVVHPLLFTFTSDAGSPLSLLGV